MLIFLKKILIVVLRIKEKNELNDEIEQLDQEIINLKSKLTQIIKK